MNTEDEARDALWDILEKYLETKLFRDSNIPEVNRLLREFENELLGWLASRASAPPTMRRIQQERWEEHLRREAPTLTDDLGDMS